MTRKYTNKLLEIVEDGIMDAEMALKMCLQYMSEDEVEDMCRVNDIFPEDEDGDTEA